MQGDDLNWWGREGLAHYVAVLSTMKTACGQTRGRELVRLNPETSEPWPRCERCKKAASQRSSDPGGER